MIRFYISNILILLSIVNLATLQSVYQVDPGATCQIYAGDPPGTPLCNDILINKNSVYIGSDNTQETLWQDINQVLYFLDTLQVPGCGVTKNFINLCAFFFPPCIELKNDQNETIAIPIRSCKESCDESFQECQIPDTPVFNCTMPENGGPRFPLVSSIYDLTSFNGNSSYTVDCVNANDIVKTNQTLSLSGNCPAPLLKQPWETVEERDKYIEEGYYFVTNTTTCVLSCPVPLFTTKQWSNLFAMSDVLSITSVILSIYLIITYVILNKKWVHSDKLLNSFFVSIFFVSLAGAIQAFHGTEKTFCPTPLRSAVQKDLTCGATGIIFHMSTIYAILFWTLMSFELWWSIKFISKKINYYKYYLLGCTVITFVFTIVPAVNYNIYYGKANVICWLKDDKYMNTCFWIPMAVCLTIATVFIGLVIYEIYKIVKSNGKQGFLQLQLKPILMIVLIYVTYLYVFSYNYYIQDNMDMFLSRVVDFFVCLSKSEDEGADCKIYGPPIGSIAMFLLIIRSYGIFVFIIYGYSAKSRAIWLSSPVFQNKYLQPILEKIRSRNSSKVTGTTESGASTNSSVSVVNDNTNKKTKKKKKEAVSVEIYSGNTGQLDSDDDSDSGPFNPDGTKLKTIY
ncbi:G-protein-coupled receptor family protein [Tieghemostelium lacteum]|uniref:G-protein-coupled receptor family protein n=1 Tax=Tieghemostelium lacteum TaxID=361077 RepID=A0A151ZSJ2_TIELA|nr:G-protein-coupled receptor family protein [Tieghemostelium lacteum]|eukprot:KYQ96900.1 G-protein-coupled receptor family protein [Tieghemostelium lacteum]